MSAAKDKLEFAWPHGELTKILDEPGPADLALLKRELHANAMSICSDDSPNGLLGAAMPDAEHLARADVNALLAPVPHPGPPPVWQAGDAQIVITAGDRACGRSLERFCVHKAATQQLKAMLMAAVPKTCCCILEDVELGFNDVTVKQLLQHLITSCGTVAVTDSLANVELLSAPIDPDQPVEALFARMVQVQAMAPANDPITDTSAIAKTVLQLEKIGVFDATVDVWNRKPEADKTQQCILGTAAINMAFNC